MSRLAIHLCQGYLVHWPRDPQIPHYAPLAARLLGERADQHAETRNLLDRLVSVWSDHPLRAEMDMQRKKLADAA
ncbi:MAG TPA: hypothetical protein VGC19_08780 [Rhodanobacter sp.]